MSTRTVDLPIDEHPSAASTGSLPHANPVCTEIPVSIQGSSHPSSSAPGAHASQPFVEQTTTVIVFAEGAVVRVSESVVPGQILIVSNQRTNQEAACRVVSVKTNSNVKGYVEIEFLQPTPGFWGADWPAAKSAKAPSAVSNRPPKIAEGVKPSPAAQPVSPAPAARATNSTPETPHTAAAAGIPYLPDLLDTLTLTPAMRQRALEPAARVESPRPAPARPERDAAKEVTAAKSPFTAWPQEPTAPAAVKPEVAKASPAADGSYVSDLLDTLTPVGETILKERPKVAPPAPAATVVAKPIFIPPVVTKSAPAPLPIPAQPLPVKILEPATTESALPHVAAGLEPAATHASTNLSAGVPLVAPEVAPLLSGGETLSRGDMFTGALPVGQSTSALPKPMRILAVAAAVAVILAAGAGVYRWEKKAGSNSNLVASSQPTAATSASTAPPSTAAPAHIAAPVATGAASSNTTPATPKNSRGNVQPPVTAQVAAPKPSAPRGPGVAALTMSAPTARSNNQAASAAAPDVPVGVENASVSNIISDSSLSGGPEAPAPLRKSSGVQQPRLLSAATPIYPLTARAEKVQGDVSVDLLIDETGKVASMNVLSGPTLLRKAALDALRTRKYSPAMLDGKPTSAHIVVVIHFQI
jgi:periplasmic protein TonB